MDVPIFAVVVACFVCFVLGTGYGMLLCHLGRKASKREDDGHV